MLTEMPDQESLTWEQLIAGSSASPSENEPTLLSTGETKKMKRSPRISLGKIVAQMSHEQETGSDTFAALIGTICHQVIEIAVAHYKAYQCEPWCQQSLESVFISASSKKMKQIKTAIKSAVLDEPTEDGILLDLAVLSQFTPAAKKYERAQQRKITKREEKQGSRFMFTVQELIPEIDHERVSRVCRPAILSLTTNPQIIEGVLHIEEKAIIPTFLQKTVATLFDFRNKGVVIDLKSFNPKKVEQAKLKIITFANAWMANVIDSGFVATSDLYGLGTEDQVLIHIARHTAEQITLSPGRYGVVLSFNKDNPSGQVTEIELDQRTIKLLTSDFNRAIQKLTGI